MSPRPKFFYCHGTAFAFRAFEEPLGEFVGEVTETVQRIFNAAGQKIPGFTPLTAGLDGFSAEWDGAPNRDAFPKLVDATGRWDVVNINYPAQMVAMGASIDIGVETLKSAIDGMPAGTPWALGGYSQGAAVCSSILVEAQSGSLTGRYNDFLGGVMFGNPRRKINYRGPVGGTWSGAWDVPGSNTGGGGSFPSTGPWARLTNPPDNWVEFAAPLDVFTSVGTSSVGNAWRQGNDIFLSVTQGDVLAALLNLPTVLAAALEAMFNVGGVVNRFYDSLNQAFQIGGNGHTVYPYLPPPDSSGNMPATEIIVQDGPFFRTHKRAVGQTAYQVALEYLNTLSGEFATVPIVVPEPAPVEPAWATTLTTPSEVLTAGWSTTLVA